ncbi:helix-turn-helix transcriptional regulator [Metabacillus fastidiosus]|uniref:Helix-turn-helix transcriptional regulator n=1 Tax=Metabacillus fastidiosus TaxID=1458 RepID=A0ABU6P2Y7_9BACI|nr:helix-turn-helix transcriptional regulator [Metabacillus fastidiosus]
MNIGQNIRYYRKLKGLTMDQIAAKMDVDRSYLSKIENNATPCSVEKLFILSEILDVPAYKFLVMDDLIEENNKWKSVIDYCELKNLNPEWVLELVKFTTDTAKKIRK